MDGTCAKERRGGTAESGPFDLAAIVERTGSSALIDLLRVKIGFPQTVFDQSVMPVIDRCAQRVQLQPASESARYDRPGGQFIRALEIGSRALDYRRGQILPRGAAPEEIGAHAHRWSHAVLTAALIAGTSGARDADIGASTSGHLADWIPDWVEEWLSQDALLVSALRGFLVDVSGGGGVGELVRRAMQDCGMSLPAVPGACDATMSIIPPLSDDVSVDPVPGVERREESVAFDAETQLLDDHEVAGGDDRVALQRPKPRASLDEEVPQRFMDWIRRGLHDRMLAVNEAGALVHFVEEGMLLVSPRVFQVFAKRYGAWLAGLIDTNTENESSRIVQRLVMRKGWHVRGDDGVNVVTYVMRGESRSSRISGVLFLEPERFVTVIPARNTRLVRAAAKPSGR